MSLISRCFKGIDMLLIYKNQFNIEPKVTKICSIAKATEQVYK